MDSNKRNYGNEQVGLVSYSYLTYLHNMVNKLNSLLLCNEVKFFFFYETKNKSKNEEKLVITVILTLENMITN